MVNMIRGVMGQVLKTNNSLKLAILTGCMRISKESIFTGLNNFTVLSCPDVEFDEYFGFTDEEVRKLLEDYGLSEHYLTVKEWYDGYHFGNTEVYCPWDVLCYCRKLLPDPDLKPQNFWINTSSNDVVKKFIRRANNQTTKREIERLVAGEGYGDIIVETEDSETGIIIEIKYAHDGNLENACQEAIAQIRNTRYDDELKENGTEKILKYGIACYLKRCKVVIE